MDIECISHKNLKSYLKSERFLHSDVLPISRHRGISHFENPKAEPEDIVLINIYEAKKLVAYLGLLPDDFYFSTQKTHVAWMSCLWVSPQSRGKGFAKKLLKIAMEKWNEKLVLTDFTPPAAALYHRTGYFENLILRKGIKYHRRLNLASFLPKKNKKWNYVNILLRVLDSVFNFFFNLKNSIFFKKINSTTEIQIIQNLDDEIVSFIKSFQKNALTKKEKRDFEWQANFPWAKNSKAAKEDQKRYFFTSFVQHFENVYLKILDKKKLVGFLVLAIKEDGLKIPFIFFDEKNINLGNEISIHVLDFMKRKKLSTITISNKTLTDFFVQRKRVFFLKRDIPKQVMISKKLKKELQNQTFSLQDGDGDSAFI